MMKMVNLLTEKAIDINYEAPDGMNALNVSTLQNARRYQVLTRVTLTGCIVVWSTRSCKEDPKDDEKARPQHSQVSSVQNAIICTNSVDTKGSSIEHSFMLVSVSCSRS